MISQAAAPTLPSEIGTLWIQAIVGRDQAEIPDNWAERYGQICSQKLYSLQIQSKETVRTMHGTATKLPGRSQSPSVCQYRLRFLWSIRGESCKKDD